VSARRIDPPRDLARVAQVADAARRAFLAGRPGDAARLADEAANTLARATGDVRDWNNGMSLTEVADLHLVPVDTVRAALGTDLAVLVWRGHGRVDEASAVAFRPRRPLPADVHERAATVAGFVTHRGTARPVEVATAFGCAERTASTALRAAVADGLLVRERGGAYTNPTTPPEAAQ
jgi:hypothetical protein